MSKKVFETPGALLDAVGEILGPTEWLLVTQDRINLFAEATDDHQWIHTDPERAKDGPYGTTIAHGYLTLSLSNLFLPQMLEVLAISAGVNVGCDRIRFVSPVPVGARIRGTGEVVAVEEKKGGVQVVTRIVIEIEGQERPAASIDSISRFLSA